MTDDAPSLDEMVRAACEIYRLPTSDFIPSVRLFRAREVLEAAGVPSLLASLAEKDRRIAEAQKWITTADDEIDHAMLTICNDDTEYGDLVHARRDLEAALAALKGKEDEDGPE
jgi:hypothetical protein